MKLRQPAAPEEILEAQKRLELIMRRMDAAIANHEFEKARFYSNEEAQERRKLRELREKHHLTPEESIVVTEADVEVTISRWSAYPFSP